MEAGVHFGHRKSRWNPKMRSFILCERSGIHIIDLEKTLTALDRACEFLRQAAAEKKNIIFVGTRKHATDVIEQEARLSGVHFVHRRWLGGILTNFQTIHLRIERLRELDEMRNNGEFYRGSKKAVASLNREFWKLEKSLGGLKKLRSRPDVLYVVDRKRESQAVTEALKLGITVVAIIDTDCDPEGVDYVIPANDDSIRSLSLITRRLAEAIRSNESLEGGGDLQTSGVPKRPLPTVGGAQFALPIPQSHQDAAGQEP